MVAFRLPVFCRSLLGNWLVCNSVLKGDARRRGPERIYHFLMVNSHLSFGFCKPLARAVLIEALRIRASSWFSIMRFVINPSLNHRSFDLVQKNDYWELKNDHWKFPWHDRISNHIFSYCSDFILYLSVFLKSVPWFSLKPVKIGASGLWPPAGWARGEPKVRS